MHLEGRMARWYLIPERMEVKWGGWRDFRVGKDIPSRVPPLWNNENGLLGSREN